MTMRQLSACLCGLIVFSAVACSGRRCRRTAAEDHYHIARSSRSSMTERVEAIRALEHMGQAEPVYSLLGSDSQNVRWHSIVSLGNLRYAPARKALERILFEDNYMVEHAVVRPGAPAKPANDAVSDPRQMFTLKPGKVPQYYDYMQTPLSVAAARALGQIGDERSVVALKKAIEVAPDGDEAAARAAVKSIVERNR